MARFHQLFRSKDIPTHLGGLPEQIVFVLSDSPFPPVPPFPTERPADGTN
jgi:hypothetical protein